MRTKIPTSSTHTYKLNSRDADGLDRRQTGNGTFEIRIAKHMLLTSARPTRRSFEIPLLVMRSGQMFAVTVSLARWK